MNNRRRIHAALALALVLAALAGSSAAARPMRDEPAPSVPAIAVHVPPPFAIGSSTASKGSSSFHWDDAGVGALVALALIGFVGALARQGRRRGQPSAI